MSLGFILWCAVLILGFGLCSTESPILLGLGVGCFTACFVAAAREAECD